MTSVTEEMIEALKPFVAVADAIDDVLRTPDDKPAWTINDVPLMWGDFRRARAALEAALSASPAAQTEVVGAWTAIIQERQRQISVEGWTPAHDAMHNRGEMLQAAVFYLHYGSGGPGDVEGRCAYREDGAPVGWPWAAQWWKPKDRRRNLERAGALCLAERDRCVRAGLSTGPADHKLGLVLRDLGAALAPSAPQPTEPVAVSEAKAKLNAVWAVLEDYRRRHDPHNGDCEVCGLIRRTDAALLNALSPERKDQSNVG